jgi:transposase
MNRRNFSPEFKAKLVLELLSGAKSLAQLCHQHSLHPNTISQWKDSFIDNAALVFQQDQLSQQVSRVAELEQLVGRLTLELEVAKKASAFLSRPHSRNGRPR